MNKSSEWNNLPRQKSDREKLKKAILKYAKKLYDQNLNDNQQKIQKLKLRLGLIDSCNDMSLVRLGHLQNIFKHYCTHIFKVAKHITFDILQYDKNHMNMDRFFLFLRDFQLISAQINGKKVEVVDKNQIILIFKKISPNAKVVSFQEFITLLERVGVMYYDAKQGGYQQRLAKQKQQRQKKKEQYQKRKKAKLAKLKKSNQAEKEKGEQNQKQQQGGEQENQEKQQKLENDNLVQQMMKDEELEDPNEEVQNNLKQQREQQTEGKQVQWQKQKQMNEQSEVNPFLNLQNDEILLILTKDQKIQYFYRKINIDSAADYKKRLSELNHPVFNNYSISARDKKRAQQKSQNKIEKSQEIDLEKSAASVDYQAEQRKRALQEKMNQKKIKQKDRPIPKPKPNEQANAKNQERKRRMQQQKQRLNKVAKSKQQTDELLQKKMDQKRVPFGSDKKRVDFDQKQISWNVMNLSIEQLKLKQFNPAKLFANQEDDRIFLDEYLDRNRGGSKALDLRQRNSTSVIDGLKKRLDQVQKTERNKEKKLKQKIGLGQLVRQKF